MHNSQALPNGLNHTFSTTYKPAKEELQENREAMNSDIQKQQQQMNSGLMRFRSAPSSLLENFIDGGEASDGFLPQSSNPEAETMFSGFNFPQDSVSPNIREIDNKGMVSQRSPQLRAIELEEVDVSRHDRFSSAWPLDLQMEQLPNRSSQNGAAIDSSFGVMNSMAIDSQQVKSGSNCANLIRHSSSPAGLFSNLNVENGNVVMRGMGNVRAGNVSNAEAASTSRLRNQTNFISSQTSSSGLLSKISVMGAENIASRIAEDGSLVNANNGGSRSYVPGYPISSWDDIPLGDNLTGLKRLRDDNSKMTSSLNQSDTLVMLETDHLEFSSVFWLSDLLGNLVCQNGEQGYRTTGLSHQLSFPMSSLEMDAMEQILQFQDSVPCKIRAKRGCATHPRSIAERVRRTRISERMRKLQELVPNMDKQTNTADMLDLAVEYIKKLQSEAKTLKDSQASCACSSKQQPNPTPAV
eukprot:TRINITY_DN5294_c0_g1_i4.p1 TRINITY_DN5294_c0_g1~~TRINITY_DN5294_c0_g1_i4.p1  ORF type:complete len:468 (-),score=108.14 TRINITY_DN5294_c0_g1_i4:495-1898(-)